MIVKDHRLFVVMIGLLCPKENKAHRLVLLHTMSVTQALYWIIALISV
ncbi:hypothetical protein [Paenibacillus terrigena]|nr:hypothetical protein [Paenibacillus terrigena]